jgi:hypothetical protein
MSLGGLNSSSGSSIRPGAGHDHRDIGDEKRSLGSKHLHATRKPISDSDSHLLTPFMLELNR